MQSTSRFEATASLQLHALIADLNWRLQMLERDILEEERHGTNGDPNSPTYSMLALTLRVRRDNLRNSIAMLEGRAERTTGQAPRAA